MNVSTHAWRQLRASCLASLSAAVLAAAAILPAAAQNAERPLNLERDLYGSNGSEAKARILKYLKDGGDPNLVLTHSTGTTAMHVVATDNEAGILEAFIAHGGNCNIRNAAGYTPLHFSAAQDPLGPGPRAIRTLIGCGANPDATNRYGDTPLHSVLLGASSFGDPQVRGLTGVGRRPDVLAALLDAGADPNRRNRAGAGDGTALEPRAADTPLLLAVKTGFDPALDLARLLLARDANPNAQDNRGITPLMAAILNSALGKSNRDFDNTVKGITMLLRSGADPDLRDRAGDTALIHAAKHEDDLHGEIGALLAGGADPCLRDRKGKVAYQHAPEDSRGRFLLGEAGGYIDLQTGQCARALKTAKQAERKPAKAKAATPAAPAAPEVRCNAAQQKAAEFIERFSSRPQKPDAALCSGLIISKALSWAFRKCGADTSLSSQKRIAMEKKASEHEKVAKNYVKTTGLDTSLCDMSEIKGMEKSTN